MKDKHTHHDHNHELCEHHNHDHHKHHKHSHHHHSHSNSSEKNILIAFFLNFCFSIFEIIGGIFTGSVAIISDAIHDFGDAISIGTSYFLEKKSKKEADEKFTFGYGRYSVLGATITSTILVFGSFMVIINSIKHIINPVELNYNGMIVFAIIGTIVNLIATFITSGGKSLNQKSVNLHMLEDVLGWVVVLIGAIIIKFTKFYFIDPILSILVAVFILYHGIISLIDSINIFLEKTPSEININKIKENILKIENITNIHDLHIWSIDGINHYATIHITTDNPTKEMKEKIRNLFEEFEIIHSTIQVEKGEEQCLEKHAHTHINHDHE